MKPRLVHLIDPKKNTCQWKASSPWSHEKFKSFSCLKYHDNHEQLEIHLNTPIFVYQNIRYNFPKTLVKPISTNNIPTGVLFKSFGWELAIQVAQTAEITSRLNAALPAPMRYQQVRDLGFCFFVVSKVIRYAIWMCCILGVYIHIFSIHISGQFIIKPHLNVSIFWVGLPY